MKNTEKWIILKNKEGGMELKPYSDPKDFEILEEFDNFTEAKEAFNFYCHILLSKFGHNMNY